MKRPAAARADEAMPALKRPAAAVVDDTLVWTKTDRDIPKKNFQSKMFHRCRKQCTKLGIHDGEISSATKVIYKKAGELYDSKH